MKPNRVKQLLNSGQVACGSWVSLANHVSAEMMGMIGFDWLLIDMEHGPGDYMTLLSQLQAIQAAGESVPIVRVQDNDPAVIKRVLDLGAYGIMVPGIKTVADAKKAVGSLKYPPQGFRGLAGNRGSKFGMDSQYTAQANDEIMLFLQVETREAIENIDEIMDVEGIDVIFLGPNDLSASLGHVGNWKHPEVEAAITKMDKAANQRGLPIGTVSRSWEEAAAWIDRGYRVQSLMGDLSFLISAAKEGLNKFHQHPKVNRG